MVFLGKSVNVFLPVVLTILPFRQYHRLTIKNIREAMETLTSDPLYYRPVAIALDTKGPEIRTGLVRGVSQGFGSIIGSFNFKTIHFLASSQELMKS